MSLDDHPILVTGGLGFLGSEFVRRRLVQGATVVNVDLNTYAADPRRLPSHDRLETQTVDVASPELERLVEQIRPPLVVHFAAESHVTRGEKAASAFFRTNVEGTRRILQAARAAGVGKFVHVSTDEVYGPCSGLPFGEADKAPGAGNATSAYARSKALADDMALGYASDVPVVVVRPTNCFGPWQHPEKAVARWTTRALRGLDLPVWGDGRHVRDWMFLEDACAGIETVIESGAVGVAYNVGPEGSPVTNLEMARAIAHAAGIEQDGVYLTEYDRPQHDRRYAVDSSRLRALGWRPHVLFEDAIAHTVSWYDRNRQWWSPLVREAESIYSDARRSTAR
jgi:dTDP-glucose 4,6-dehydratase